MKRRVSSQHPGIDSIRKCNQREQMNKGSQNWRIERNRRRTEKMELNDLPRRGNVEIDGDFIIFI